MSKPKFLFLCTGNSARSQMAEALLRAYAGEHFEVYSAGLEPKTEILPAARAVMAEIGLNMEGQYPKSVNEYLDKFNFACTVTVCGNAEEKCPRVFLNMGKHLFWPFEDPAANHWLAGRNPGTGAANPRQHGQKNPNLAA